jgi:hypothetical protein
MAVSGAWARVRAMSRRLAGLAASAALQLVALVLAHQLVYLARYGSLYGEALVHSGHGDAWGAAVTTSVMLAAGLAALAVLRLGRLGFLLRRRGAGASTASGSLEARSLLKSYLRIAPRLVALLVVMLTTQENVELVLNGQGMPGPAILLSPEYAGGLWIAIAVGLAVAFVAALFRWREQVLLGRLRATRTAPARDTRASAPRPAVIDRPSVNLLGRRSALRAPPVVAAS